MLCCSGKRYAGAPLLGRRCCGVAAGAPRLGRYGQQPPIPHDRQSAATEGMRLCPAQPAPAQNSGADSCQTGTPHPTGSQWGRKGGCPTQPADNWAGSSKQQAPISPDRQSMAEEKMPSTSFFSSSSFRSRPCICRIHVRLCRMQRSGQPYKPATAVKTAVARTAAGRPVTCAAPRLSMRCLGRTSDGAWCASASRSSLLACGMVQQQALGTPLIQPANCNQAAPNCSLGLPGAPAPRTAPSFPGNPSTRLQPNCN